MTQVAIETFPADTHSNIIAAWIKSLSGKATNVQVVYYTVPETTDDAGNVIYEAEERVRVIVTYEEGALVEG